MKKIKTFLKTLFFVSLAVFPGNMEGFAKAFFGKKSRSLKKHLKNPKFNSGEVISCSKNIEIKKLKDKVVVVKLPCLNQDKCWSEDFKNRHEDDDNGWGPCFNHAYVNGRIFAESHNCIHGKNVVGYFIELLKNPELKHKKKIKETIRKCGCWLDAEKAREKVGAKDTDRRDAFSRSYKEFDSGVCLQIVQTMDSGRFDATTEMSRNIFRRVRDEGKTEVFVVNNVKETHWLMFLCDEIEINDEKWLVLSYACSLGYEFNVYRNMFDSFSKQFGYEGDLLSSGSDSEPEASDVESSSDSCSELDSDPEPSDVDSCSDLESDGE